MYERARQTDGRTGEGAGSVPVPVCVPDRVPDGVCVPDRVPVSVPVPAAAELGVEEQMDVGRLDSVEALYIHTARTAAHHAPTATVPNAQCPMQCRMWDVGCGWVGGYGYVLYVESVESAVYAMYGVYAVYVTVCSCALAVLQPGRNAVSPRPVGSVHAAFAGGEGRGGEGESRQPEGGGQADRSECCPEC